MMTRNRFPPLEIPLPDFVVADADGWVHFAGHRVGLSSVVRAYLDGYSPEMLASEYPELSLATIHKTKPGSVTSETVDAEVRALRDATTSDRLIDDVLG